jgi:hypothetical protein
LQIRRAASEAAVTIPTLDELLVLAHRLAEGWEPNTYPHQLAQGLIDLLGEAQPCGVSAFEVRNGRILIGDANSLEVGGEMDPDVACAIAAMLLRAAGEARHG